MSIKGKYICAFTAMGDSYPEYFNAYQYGDEIELTMREKPVNGTEGTVTSVRLPTIVFKLMMEDVQKNLK